jgi:hypothetical protein
MSGLAPLVGLGILRPANKENLMRYASVLLVLLLAACGDKGSTRNFGMSRDAAPETTASTQTPLSMPPNFADRPRPPGAFQLHSANADSDANQPDVGTGQDALLEAAGPLPPGNIRSRIDENSGLVFPPRDFVDGVMNWTPPPGYVPLVTHASKGWFDWF